MFFCFNLNWWQNGRWKLRVLHVKPIFDSFWLYVLMTLRTHMTCSLIFEQAMFSKDEAEAKRESYSVLKIFAEYKPDADNLMSLQEARLNFHWRVCAPQNDILETIMQESTSTAINDSDMWTSKRNTRNRAQDRAWASVGETLHTSRKKRFMTHAWKCGFSMNRKKRERHWM